MKVAGAAVALLATIPALSHGQVCVQGGFEFEFDGACSGEVLVEAYAHQVFDAAGATSPTCTNSAEQDLAAIMAGAGLAGLGALCDLVYDTQEQVPFTAAARRGKDWHFERMFFNGRTDWQEEVETIYENEDGTATSVLRDDAEQVNTFYRGTAQGRRVEWPGSIPNFQSGVTDDHGVETCTTNAAMCCWPKDRQANDNNGNCATPYDENCVSKDPADNTNLCHVDLERGSASTGYDSSEGLISFPQDNHFGEGSIHCHGLAWSNDANDHTARYKANNLFFVSMYDHMYQRGYVENIPGAPMCGCVEQMPTVSRSDCTQVDLTEKVKITYNADTNKFFGKIEYVDVDFNACRGINNRNNDLWAYIARLYYQEDITREQFSEAGRIITDVGCEEATNFALNEKGMTRGYDHDVDTYTLVAGRDDFFDGHPYGREAFNRAFFKESLTLDNPIIYRVCATCVSTHQKIWYRRKTNITDPNFDLLHNILYQRNDGNGRNRWGEDFSLHSTYEDAVSGENSWKCPNDSFDYGDTFTGECSPDGTRVREQYSIFNWWPGPRPQVAYYVNKPQYAGLRDLDLSSSAIFSPAYTDVDIGHVGIKGRVWEADDGVHVTGAGWDIWGWSDMGHFLSEPATGDVIVTVHVSAFTGIVNEYAKAGVMIRSDNSPDAMHAYAMLSGDHGVCMTYRRSKKNYSHKVGDWVQTSPIQKSAWLRLVKKGDTVEMYISDDGADWAFHQSVELLFPEDTFRIGLAVTSHDDRYVSEAVFEDYSVEEYNFPTSSPTLSNAPTPWDPVANVGSSRPGSHWYNAEHDVYITRGYGTGIWGTSDSFFFQRTQHDVSGPMEVTVYVNYFSTHWKEAKGGIMIRDSDDPDSAHAFLGMAGYWAGVTLQSRGSAGDQTEHLKTDWVHDNRAHLRLSKAASEADGSAVVTAYYKAGAEGEWKEMGSTYVAFTGHALQVGIAVTSGDPQGNGYADLQTKSFEINGAAASGRKMLRA